MTRIVPFATAAAAVLLGAGSAVAQSLSVDLG